MWRRTSPYFKRYVQGVWSLLGSWRLLWNKVGWNMGRIWLNLQPLVALYVMIFLCMFLVKKPDCLVFTFRFNEIKFSSLIWVTSVVVRCVIVGHTWSANFWLHSAPWDRCCLLSDMCDASVIQLLYSWGGGGKKTTVSKPTKKSPPPRNLVEVPTCMYCSLLHSWVLWILQGRMTVVTLSDSDCTILSMN